ncbi:MAG: hypothetical protein M0019_08600 [Actinomycetota bacterium]|nr:hypothetical protein [Actinomycetota bacterium]
MGRAAMAGESDANQILVNAKRSKPLELVDDVCLGGSRIYWQDVDAFKNNSERRMYHSKVTHLRRWKPDVGRI